MITTSYEYLTTFTLPLPPSSNRYWRVARGIMHVSSEAKAYKQAAAWEAKMQGVRCMEGAVSVVIDVYRKRKAGDLDNFAKCLLDSLIGIAYADDSQIVEIHLRRFDDPKNPRAVVTVEALVA